jgi:hypothetical protein
VRLAKENSGSGPSEVARSLYRERERGLDGPLILVRMTHVAIDLCLGQPRSFHGGILDLHWGKRYGRPKETSTTQTRGAG